MRLETLAKLTVFAPLAGALMVSGARADKPAADDESATTGAPVQITRTVGDDWPVFLGPTGDNKSREVGIVAKWPKAGPPVVWQRPLATGYPMPVISAGRLFEFERHKNRARLNCLESETGRFLWKFEYPTDYEDLYGYDNGPRASPLVDDDRVYIYGAEGMLHCLRVSDGKRLWQVDTQADFGVVQNFFGVGSSPVVEGELLLVQVGGSKPESRPAAPGRLNQVEPNGTCVVAFDKRSGKVRYKLGDDLASYATPRLATIGPRRWCFVFARGGLLGFDPVGGKVDFHFPWRASILESVNASDPVVVGDRVFISETYGPGSALLKVRPGGCEVVWSDEKRRRDKSLQTHWNTPIHHEGYLYASSGRHTADAELRCIELASGKPMWSEPNLTRSTLLYADGCLVCLSEDGKLRLLRATPQRYTPLAEVVLEDPQATGGKFGPAALLKYPAWAPPLLSHGLLYVRGHDRLVCLELIPAGGQPSAD